MEDEDAELEEGEAKEPLDPDKDFSYLDSRLERLLGDCQKEFQGGNLSTEKLGSKYGGYGTFLPTQARVPSVLADPHPANPAAEVGRPVVEGVAPESAKRSAGTSVQQVIVKENGVIGTVAANKVKLKIKLVKQAPDTDEAKRKALYNGLGLDDLSDDDDPSLDDDDDDDDDDNYSRSNVESPEPSPMAMIEMMTVACPEGGLLSPLSESTLELVDAKEANSYLPRPGNLSTATSGAFPSDSKGHQNSPRAPGSDFRKSKGSDADKPNLDAKKNVAAVADSNGGRKSRRDSDADKTSFVKERQSKAGRNDIVVRGEPQESVDEKTMEGVGKEEFDIVRDPAFSKSSRKPHDVHKPPTTVNGQKEKEGTDTKGPGKTQVFRIRDSKDFSRSKLAGKAPPSKDNEVFRMSDSGKESYDKGVSLSDVQKQAKEDSKLTAPVGRVKENPKEGFKEIPRKDASGDPKSKDLSRDAAKPSTNPSAAKKPSAVSGRKGVPLEHKNSKNSQDKKPFMKESEKDRMSLSEPVASTGEEKVPAAVLATPPVVPQLVLENWVACDRCEKWRMLMPNMDPISPSKKWRCKMMDWLQGMNNCKFSEDETTAAVYKLLGLQNPAALSGATLPAAAAAAAPVASQAPIPLAEPVLDKWADEVDTKKNFLPKKGVARKLQASGAKAAGGKGVDGAVKSKNINDMGHDYPGDGVLVSDKPKSQVREKVKRSRPSEGDDTRAKKKAVLEQDRTIESSQWGREAMDLDPVQTEKERVTLVPPGETQGSGLWKRKKAGTLEDLDETPNLKKNKGGRARLQFDDPHVPSEDDYVEIDKRGNVQKPKRETSMLKPKGVSHSGLQEKETQDINAVLKDLRGDHDGAPEKRREDKIQGRKSKASEKPWRLKEDASDSEQRTWKTRRDEDRPNQASPLRRKSTYAAKEETHRSTSSKVSISSSGSSGLGLKGVASPLVSTVSSSPLRAAANGNNNSRELFNARVGPGGHAADIAVQSSPDSKHVRNASRGSSLDEGEYRHPGVTHNSTRFAKQDSSGEARDDGWYDEEDRGVDRGQNHDRHTERHPHSSGDADDVNGQQVRRKGNRERDSDSRRLDIRDNDHVDAKDRNTARDERGRLLRDSGLDKPCERPLEEAKSLDGTKYTHRRDDASTQGHAARAAGLPIKDINRESDRLRKDASGIAVGLSDFTRKPGVSSSTRGLGDRGEALKRDELDVGLSKTSGGEAATSSPVKKDKEQHAQIMQTATNYLKDAKDLKHSADRLKNADETESTNLYLQSALKFLQSAALLESVQAETRSMDLYKDTAVLCEFCAIQYKRRGDFRATALAYTCAAVARTRLMMSKRTSFANDCKEFQSAAQLTSGPHMPSNGSHVHAGESPSSSSASDVDNLNKHHGLFPGNKASLGKAAIVSPQVPSAAGGTSLNTPARLRPNASRFLRDALDMNALLDSWKTAADATAKAEASKETKGMANVKQVGELGGLGDIDGVVRLVRVALDAIGH